MVAVPLIFGRLTAEDYSDQAAADPRIDALRAKTTVRENPQFTKDYFDPEKRYIGNSVQVFFKDGSKTGKVSIDYPIGHRRRRAEGIPVLLDKFHKALAGHLPRRQADEIAGVCKDPTKMLATPVPIFMDLFAVRPQS
jgi:2-methylcitrate dehydratase